MNSFELFLTTSLHHYSVFFIITFIASLTLGYIFKKNETYYVILLSTFVLFSSFYKELFTNIPIYPTDIQNIVANFTGAISGILTKMILQKQSNKKRRLV
jgi:hypothetical protein